jgi:hypothetical protein
MNICSITVLPIRGGRAFDLIFYGLDASDLMTVSRGYGASIVAAALRHRGLDPAAFTSSPFHVTRLHSLITEGLPDTTPPLPVARPLRVPKLVPPPVKTRRTKGTP